MSLKILQSKNRTFAMILAGFPLMLATAQPVSAQVTVFKAPPTAEQFRQALIGNTAAPATAEKPLNLGRSRGLVWKGEGKVPENNAKPDESLATESANAPAKVTASTKADANAPAAGLPISFKPGSTRIAKRSRAYINTVVEVLNDDPSINLVIEGHTDSSGSYPRNMVLSWERAMGVYKVLVQRYGVEPKRLSLVGKGPTEPLPGHAPTDGENRRVQFRLGG